MHALVCEIGVYNWCKKFEHFLTFKRSLEFDITIQELCNLKAYVSSLVIPLSERCFFYKLSSPVRFFVQAVLRFDIPRRNFQLKYYPKSHK